MLDYVLAFLTALLVVGILLWTIRVTFWVLL